MTRVAAGGFCCSPGKVRRDDRNCLKTCQIAASKPRVRRLPRTAIAEDYSYCRQPHLLPISTHGTPTTRTHHPKSTSKTPVPASPLIAPFPPTAGSSELRTYVPDRRHA